MMRALAVAAFVALAGCATQTPDLAPGLVALDASDAHDETTNYGVLVMAHGGSQRWNETVLAAVEPLHEEYPVEVAFGMADAGSLEAGVRALQTRGVRKIGVVRLFISADSFLERTEQILGLRSGAPEKAEHSAHGEAAGGGHAMGFWRIATDASFALSIEGLAEAPEMGDVLRDRARALSRDATHEDLLVLAHGPENDAENERWLDYMRRLVAPIGDELPFDRIEVATLREDWPEKRAPAERYVREFVATATAEGRTVIVLPFRVSGFGPYAEVLEGLDYIADEQGLVPHEAVTRWLARQADTLRNADAGVATASSISPTSR